MRSLQHTNTHTWWARERKCDQIATRVCHMLRRLSSEDIHTYLDPHLTTSMSSIVYVDWQKWILMWIPGFSPKIGILVIVNYCSDDLGWNALDPFWIDDDVYSVLMLSRHEVSWSMKVLCWYGRTTDGRAMCGTVLCPWTLRGTFKFECRYVYSIGVLVLHLRTYQLCVVVV